MKLLRSPDLWLVVILFAAAAIRLYRLEDYIQFLGDQGRDVLVVKRMIVDGIWTLLGPNASVGGFFTGPIYYYFMIPFLLLFGLQPVGPAVLAVVFGLGTVILIYYFCKTFFNSRVAILAAALMAVSPKMVEISRYSWNPNPVPFFTILTVLCLYQSHKLTKLRFTFLAGVSLGIMYELHYISLAFVPIVGIMLIVLFPNRKLFWQMVALGTGFAFGDLPFFIFELKHGFPNTMSVIEFVTRNGKTVAPRDNNVVTLVLEILRRDYEAVLKLGPTATSIFLFMSLGAFILWVAEAISAVGRRPKIVLMLCWVLLGAIGIGLYQGQLFDHYFIYLFPIPIILIALLGDLLARNKISAVVFMTVFSLLLYQEVMGLYFWQPPNRMLTQIQQIDGTVLSLAGGKPYNLALIAARNSDHSYRYYLEIWNQKPVTIENPEIDPGRTTVTDQLIVICEDKDCKPLGHPLWEIAGFGRAEIASEIPGPAGIRIFKLVHYGGS